LLELAIRVGMSADFAHVYYTDSDEYRAFSQAIFLELWPRGLFYRAGRPSFWCPVCETTLAEADIEYEDRASSLVWMKFPLSSGSEIKIATTRPELLAACRAVMVHPDDERYRPLQGKKARVPLYNHEVPIGSRSLNPIEFISSDAWYLKQLEFREDLKRLAHEMEFRPLRHRQLLLDWTESLTIDWPISRRRFYHTEIPLWYCKKCGETLAP